ncbi:hypothetical protein [Arthrobacter ramosus]|uniref:Uncharacterized protein n=1 Tax=Arthrobacter ramosus TaxID=1672 RepID=A0ABV5XZC7_ARTRM|nr:hypothetical protein [Arthrobacter ramosus]
MRGQRQLTLHRDEHGESFALASDGLPDEANCLIDVDGLSARYGVNIHAGPGGDPLEEEFETLR